MLFLYLAWTGGQVTHPPIYPSRIYIRVSILLYMLEDRLKNRGGRIDKAAPTRPPVLIRYGTDENRPSTCPQTRPNLSSPVLTSDRNRTTVR